MSGFSWMTCSMASFPSLASPQTWKPCQSKSERMVVRAAKWSSTIRIFAGNLAPTKYLPGHAERGPSRGRATVFLDDRRVCTIRGIPEQRMDKAVIRKHSVREESASALSNSWSIDHCLQETGRNRGTPANGRDELGTGTNPRSSPSSCVSLQTNGTCSPASTATKNCVRLGSTLACE